MSDLSKPFKCSACDDSFDSQEKLKEHNLKVRDKKEIRSTLMPDIDYDSPSKITTPPHVDSD
jgi:hypothetical protein